MGNRKNVQHRGRTLPTGALLVCLLIGGPAAQAAFTSGITATMTASTHTLAAPAGNTVSASCAPIGNSGKHRLSITVTHHGAVPKATNYVLKVVDPAGHIQANVDLNQGGTFQNNAATGGWWTYSIAAQYRVPGSTNVWTSNAPVISVYC